MILLLLHLPVKVGIGFKYSVVLEKLCYVCNAVISRAQKS